MENLKKTIGENLALLRKAKGLTQAELGEIFSYTDRAVSKWENGDTLPDIDTLYALCEYYGVTLDYLTKEDNKDKIIVDQKRVTTNHILVTILMSSIIWMIATIIFVYTMLYSPDTLPYWLVFVWAVPLNAILIAVMNRMYFRIHFLYYICYSVIVWSLLAGVFLQILIFGEDNANTWPIFLIGIPLQISLALAMNIKFKLPAKEEKK